MEDLFILFVFIIGLLLLLYCLWFWGVVYVYIRYYYFRLFDNSFSGLRRFLNSVPNINCGGCGLSAYIMYLYMGRSGFIVGYSNGYSTNNLVKKGIINNSSSHVYYKYCGLYYDSDGVYKKADIMNITWCNSNSLYKYKDSEILSSIKDSSVWSSDFIYRDLLLKLFKI
jgi:hypothetical protein